METMVKTRKMQILEGLATRFGNGQFKYTDIVKEVLVTRGIIATHADYNWREHRGYYSCAINQYPSKNQYMYISTERSPMRLVRDYTGTSTRYRVLGC